MAQGMKWPNIIRLTVAEDSHVERDVFFRGEIFWLRLIVKKYWDDPVLG
jgi:hypothetical protein